MQAGNLQAGRPFGRQNERKKKKNGQKKNPRNTDVPGVCNVARRTGVEPTAFWSVARCSIH